jgi:hypothetical protein
MWTFLRLVRMYVCPWTGGLVETARSKMELQTLIFIVASVSITCVCAAQRALQHCIRVQNMNYRNGVCQCTHFRNNAYASTDGNDTALLLPISHCS